MAHSSVKTLLLEVRRGYRRDRSQSLDGERIPRRSASSARCVLACCGRARGCLEPGKDKTRQAQLPGELRFPQASHKPSVFQAVWFV